jgi:hypothetical protein
MFMRRKKRGRGAASPVEPFCMQSFEPRQLLSAAVAETTLRVPVPQAPASPWITAHGTAEPDDEMFDSMAVSPGGVSAGIMAVLGPVQDFSIDSNATTPQRLYLSKDHGSRWTEVDEQPVRHAKPMEEASLVVEATCGGRKLEAGVANQRP